MLNYYNPIGHTPLITTEPRYIGTEPRYICPTLSLFSSCFSPKAKHILYTNTKCWVTALPHNIVAL
jgi:hypothetical protein